MYCVVTFEGFFKNPINCGIFANSIDAELNLKNNVTENRKGIIFSNINTESDITKALSL